MKNGTKPSLSAVMRLLLLILLLMPLAVGLLSCRKAADGDGDSPGIFRGTEIALPDGWGVFPAAAAQIGKEGVLVLATDGTSCALLTIDAETLSVTDSRPLPLDDGDELLIATLADGGILLVTRNAAGTALRRIPFGDGETTCAENIETHFERMLDYGVDAMEADADGTVYLLSWNEIGVFDAQLNYQGSAFLPDRTGRLARRADGSVAALITSGAAAIDTKTMTLAKTESMPSGLVRLLTGEDGREYFADSTGVKRLERKGNHRPVMDYLRSELTAATLMGVLDGDRILLAKRGDPFSPAKLALYVRSDDAAQSGDVELTVAAYRLTPLLKERVVNFNETHPDARVTVKDYSEYNTDEEARADYMMTLELTTGTAKPDIVFAPADAVVMQQIVQKKYYVNLAPFLDRDPTLTRDAFFGGILCAFDDGDGGLWGMSAGFGLNTLLSTRTILEENGIAVGTGYLPKQSWTIGEMLDFIEGLPEGIFPMRALWQESAVRQLMGRNGYAAFIDRENGVCSFDSADFLHLLRFLKSLPATYEDLKRASALDRAENADVLREYCFGGKVALSAERVGEMNDIIGFETVFGTKNFVLAGYPSADRTDPGAGIEVSPGASYAITTTCETPSLAWEFIRELIAPDDLFWIGGIPSVKSLFDQLAEQEERNVMVVTYSDEGQSGHVFPADDPDAPQSAADLREPGLVLFFTAADAENLKGLLDGVGTPLAFRVDDEVRAIVEEEIGEFLAGIGTETSCAARIQSRVGIWLAEHK